MKLGFDIDDSHKITVFHRPGHVAQLITNLLINAISHGFNQRTVGRVKISLRVNNDKVKMTFKDNGQGIPDDIIHKIFEPFYTTKRGDGGSGLGLHIVYNIVNQNLKGSISVASAVGKGTTFTVNFPLRTDY